MTATPREEIDKNTYDLFELEPGVPTDAYELTTAVRDEFLVPPKVQQVDLKFPREGIDYDELLEGDADRFASGRAEFVSGETKGDRAVVFLEEVLSGGAVAAREVNDQAKQQGLTEITLRRAKKALNVKAFKRKDVWYCSLRGKEELPLLEKTESADVEIPFADGFGSY